MNQSKAKPSFKLELAKLDLKKLANSELVGSLTKHLTQYEGKLKKLLNEFDLKSREARSKGQKQIDKVSQQFRQTRGDLEKRVTNLLHQEGKRLNEGVNDLVNYLKSVAKSEKLVMKASATKRKPSKGQGGDHGTSAKRAQPRKPRARKAPVSSN